LMLASASSAQQSFKPVSEHIDRGTGNSLSTTSGQAAVPTAMSPREVLEMHGDILMARKEYPAAVTVYLQILTAEPKNAEMMNKVGVAYQQIGDLDHSGRFYKRAMQADKNFASAVNNYGTVEYEKKHYGKSISLYKKAIVLRPEMPTLYSNLGYAYFMVMMQAFNGAGDTITPTIVNFFGFWLFEIPLAYWLAIPLHLRSNGAFFAIAIAETAMAAASAILFKQGRWKKQKI